MVPVLISKLAGGVTVISPARLLPATVYDCEAEGVPATVVKGVSDEETEINGDVEELMVKVKATDVPPPGAGLVTSTFTVPAVAISATEIGAVKVVLFT